MNADKRDMNGFKNLVWRVYARNGVLPRTSVVNIFLNSLHARILKTGVSLKRRAAWKNLT
jgi:hypothetical protein